LLQDRDRELAEAYDEIERLHGEIASMKAELAELEGKKWAVRDSVTY
jgi:hypothetical protein